MLIKLFGFTYPRLEDIPILPLVTYLKPEIISFRYYLDPLAFLNST